MTELAEVSTHMAGRQAYQANNAKYDICYNMIRKYLTCTPTQQVAS